VSGQGWLVEVVPFCPQARSEDCSIADRTRTKKLAAGELIIPGLNTNSNAESLTTIVAKVEGGGVRILPVGEVLAAAVGGAVLTLQNKRRRPEPVCGGQRMLVFRGELRTVANGKLHPITGAIGVLRKVSSKAQKRSACGLSVGNCKLQRRTDEELAAGARINVRRDGLWLG